MPQAFYNHLDGVRRLTTETGAGQWGTALAFACAQFDLDLKVYMVRASYEQKPYRRIAIETWGGEVVPSPVDEPGHPGSLGSAISDAVRDCVGRDDTHYALGSVLNHVLLHQTVIGLEAKEQLELAGERLPDVVIAPCGGGSNLGGIAFPFVPDAGVRLLAVEPLSCPTLTQGRFEYDFGDTAGLTPLMPMYTLGHDFVPPAIHAGGLRYHGDSPLVSALVRDGRMEAVAYPQGKVFEAAVQFAKVEGRIPAPECGARDPRGRRRGPRREGDRRGEGHPVQLLRPRVPGPVGVRRLPGRSPGRRAGLSRHVPGEDSERDVDPPPGLVVDQPPAMAATGGVLGQQDVARPQPETGSVARLEIERAAERHHVLAFRGRVPGEGGAGAGLLEPHAGDGLDR